MTTKEMNDRTRTLAAGNLLCTDIGRGMLRIERKTETQYGETVACVIPGEILEDIQNLHGSERRQLMKWMGFEVAYQPVLFSQRLDECCRPGVHAGIAARLARDIGVSDMCICHWRRKHSLPTEDQARRIAELLGWDPEEALLDLRYELGLRAAASRKLVVAGGRTFVERKRKLLAMQEDAA